MFTFFSELLNQIFTLTNSKSYENKIANFGVEYDWHSKVIGFPEPKSTSTVNKLVKKLENDGNVVEYSTNSPNRFPVVVFHQQNYNDDYFIHLSKTIELCE